MAVTQPVEGCLQIRGLVVHSYALLDEDSRDVTLIDGGFLGDRAARIEEALQCVDRTLDDVSTILLTHGHIDHTLRISELQEKTGASVLAPAGEERHIAGNYPYRGISRICGLAETFTRKLFRYQPPEIERWLRPDEMLDLWGGLQVIHLPGHTHGHCGFYSERHKLLFSGDLFANFFGFARRPPPWFNVDGRQIGESLKKADTLDLSGGVLPNHCHRGSPDKHREDLSKLARRFGQNAALE